MAVKARFWIKDVLKTVVSRNQDGTPNLFFKVTMAPTTRANSDDNIDWSQYSPSGEFWMGITKLGAQGWCEENQGKDVSITIEVIEPIQE